MVKKDERLQEAIELIEVFCREEYESESGIGDDLESIGLAYTNTEDDEHEIQVEVNLLNYTVSKFIDNKLFHSEKYRDLDLLIENQLEHLDFSELVYVDSDELEDFIKEEAC